ncbi:hypothetical protein [Pseudopedobacter beijingensis]|uniref:Uncharacterized protein n=1 Tax=Pseudopedobacter beijingensis TaxID=1207056 RepID=A0ABW4I9Y9_9SPHI
MSIPSSSSVLITDINYASLVLGAYLAQNGISVFMIDNGESIPDNTIFSFDSYALQFLKEAGFQHQQSFNDIFSESKNIITRNLCNISWQTQLSTKQQKGLLWDISLIVNGSSIKHESKTVINGKELLIADNENLTIKNVAILSWKLEGILNNYIHSDILMNQKDEEALLKAYLLKDDSLSSKLRNLFSKPKPSDINLRESKTNLHLSQDRTIEAGDLIPNLDIYDEKTKSMTSFDSWFVPGSLYLIILGTTSQQNLFNIAKWIKTNFPIRLFYIPYSERNDHIFRFFKVVDGEKKTIIIRPDRFIGLILDRIDLEVLDNYLCNFLFFKTKNGMNMPRKFYTSTSSAEILLEEGSKP